MRNLIFLLIGFITSSATAQTTVYKVSKDRRVIYLGGTVHLLRAQDYPLPDEFDLAYNDAEVVTFETDTKVLQDRNIAQKLMLKGMYQDDRTLKTVLADTTYAKLEAAFDEYNLPIAMMQKMKPALAITTLSAMNMQAVGMSAQGVDMYFTNKAIADKKEIQQLESVEVQLEKMTSMGDGDENAFVNYSLNSMDEMQDEMDQLIENWKTGASDKMEEEITKMKSAYLDTYTSLMADRNNSWMPKILSYLESGTKAFVLVGSLHLYGPDGLISLLKQQGYKVEKL